MQENKYTVNRHGSKSLIVMAVALCALSGTIGCGAPQQPLVREDAKGELGKSKSALVSKATRERAIYNVTIKTVDAQGAGTNAEVYIQLIGDKGKTPDELIRLDNKGNDFEKGHTDEYHFVSEEVGRLKQVRMVVLNRAKDSDAEWHPKYVEVKNRDSSNIARAYFKDQWFNDKNIDRTVDVSPPDDESYDDFEDAQKNMGGLARFEEPADDINYVDYRYVGSHNAFCYERFFNIRQHEQPIVHQLVYGVRGLMLDTYNWSDQKSLANGKTGSGTVVLSHNDVGFMASAQKGHKPFQTLEYELRRVIEFLLRNPRAVVTIILEEHANIVATQNEIGDVLAEAGLGRSDLILRPDDWTGGTFPTLGWMRKENRRLVIFTGKSPTGHYTWHLYDYSFENNYNALTDDERCEESKASAASTAVRPRVLVTFNNFPSGLSGSGVTQAASQIKDRVMYTTAKGLMGAAQAKSPPFADGRIFNGYWADQVIGCAEELGRTDGVPTILDYVNSLNRRANKTEP